ncbi:ATP-binding protein [Methanoregula sp.]|uniref:ATP-binding protein n=1 Tax=Methanoregula sp. TaxID=2052170 RepID=UPI002369A961|nr:ATP-binding protein [Methanoregula sp.]MDD1686281.1 ATP-binding protein [Methanoregula sp.]
MDEKIRIALESQNPWWFNRPFATGTDRFRYFPELRHYLAAQEILLLAGARRTGKSTLVYQIIRSLLDAGARREAILYINLDEPLFVNRGKDPAFLRELIEDHCTLHSDITQFYICIDEIQNFVPWAPTVKTLYDTKPDLKLILTGSSSSLLQREISTRLSGRYFCCTVYPLSFAECLDFLGIDHPSIIQKRQYFGRYLEYGGFPRVTLEPQDELKKEILKNYYETIYLKDIIYPNNVRNNSDLYDVLYYLISNTGTPLSYNRIADALHLAPETVREYIGYAESAFLFYPVKKFDYSVKKQLANPKKIYCIDTGIINAVAFAFSENRGWLLENAVFMTLKRTDAEIYYHKNRYECDFLVKVHRKITSAIQVTDSLENPDTRAREIRGVCEAMEAYDLEGGLILTMNESGEETIAGRRIRIMPVYEWLENVRNGI